jgi:hypothetical protein
LSITAENTLTNQFARTFVIFTQEFMGKIWRHEAGKALMKAIGFSAVVDSFNPDGSTRSTIGLSALPTEAKSITKLSVEVLQMIQSRRTELDEEIVALEGAPSVAAAVREMRTHHSVSEVRTGLETALTIIRNVLNQPKDIRMYRIKRGNPAFHRSLGRLHASELLMHAIGFSGADREERNALATGGPTGTVTGSDALTATGTMEKSVDFPATGTSGPFAGRNKAAVFILKSVSKTGFDPAANLPEGTGNRPLLKHCVYV